ncbi:MAG: hypothetical protein ACREOE_01575 [Gemmatimonadales bacterium]
MASRTGLEGHIELVGRFLDRPDNIDLQPPVAVGIRADTNDQNAAAGEGEAELSEVRPDRGIEHVPTPDAVERIGHPPEVLQRDRHIAP